MCSLLAAHNALAQTSTSAVRELPWSRPDQPTRSTSPVELLALHGITLEDLQGAGEFANADDKQVALVARILHRVAVWEPQELIAWQQHVDDWAHVSTEIDSHRGRIFRLKGTATHIIPYDLPEEIGESLGFKRVYAVTLELHEGLTAQLWVRDVPSSWLTKDALPTPAAADGLLLQADGTEQVRLACAAGRMAWYPTEPLPEHDIGRSHVHLASLGVDIGLFESLRQRNSRELVPEDREIACQVLAATAAKDTHRLPRELFSDFHLESLLVEPQKHQGELFKFNADARRITWVAISSPDLRQRYGVEGYYEIDITLPVGERPIRLRGANDADGPIYEYKYPATLCVLRLPPELDEIVQRASREPSGAGLLRQRITIAAYFFKIWPYRSPYTAQFGREQVHLSPLFFGTSVNRAPPDTPPRNYVTPIFAGVFVVGLLGAWWAMRVTHRRDLEAHRRSRKGVDRIELPRPKH